MNGIMTLNDVVGGYQQGVREGQQQREYERQQKEQATLEQADKAASSVLDKSKAEWALNGAQGEYKPNDMTMFKAAEARGQALAQAGHWKGFMQNEVAVQQQRLRARSAALQQYEMDGDGDKLARSVYPTFFDGKEIVGSEFIKGGVQSPTIGAKPQPDKIRFKFSDGTTNAVEPGEIARRVKLSLVDPATMAEKEIAANLAAAKARAEADEKIRIEGEKGKQDRLTEAQKAEAGLAKVGVETDGRLKVAGVEGETRLKAAETTAGATLGAAKTRANATVEAARLGATGRDKAGGASDKIKDFKAVHDEVTRFMGDPSNSMLGSGSRISTEATNTIATVAKKAIDAGEAPEDAIRGAAQAWKKANAPAKGGK